MQIMAQIGYLRTCFWFSQAQLSAVWSCPHSLVPMALIDWSTSRIRWNFGLSDRQVTGAVACRSLQRLDRGRLLFLAAISSRSVSASTAVARRTRKACWAPHFFSRAPSQIYGFWWTSALKSSRKWVGLNVQGSSCGALVCIPPKEANGKQTCMRRIAGCTGHRSAKHGNSWDALDLQSLSCL